MFQCKKNAILREHTTCGVLPEGGGLCDELITHTEESCQLQGITVCDLETS
jgi:hypothetical protein